MQLAFFIVLYDGEIRIDEIILAYRFILMTNMFFYFVCKYIGITSISISCETKRWVFIRYSIMTINV